ncbi:MAG TPA: hypothetical protein VGC76_17125 [Pyrinomonadaceae bacterium]
MPVRESSATALIRVRGLGIACFNDTRERGEVALIRDTRHTLSIRISKPSFVEEAGIDTVSYDDVVTYEAIDPMDVSIEINGVGKSVIGGYELFTDGDFNRLSGENDENDLRWIVQMESDELHGHDLIKNDALLEQNSNQVSRLYIENALFYTSEVNENFFFEKIKKDAQENEIGREDFGYIAETLGAKIEAEYVRFNLKIGFEEHTHVFPRVVGSPVKIEITNTDLKPEAVISDMPDYYRFLQDAGGVNFDLNNVNNDETGEISGDSTTGEEFCHIVWSKQPCIESFLSSAPNPCA